MSNTNTNISPPIVRDESEPILIHLQRTIDKRATARGMHDSMGPGHVATIASAERYRKSRESLDDRIRDLIDSHNKLVEIHKLLRA